ncbi:BfmA/BtgA family mobilization protein [Flavobacterium yafengii]|uniref:BfmA/BtgA family mobilization protein n=1 Tax=Flavobacterium yafengii TaxID=3041253 RepID=UPI0024A8A5D7|nr:BfmA/BtgA family mobilization protein [Flavobacterium yafengii]MDI5899450.1 BfmA/BtgA family mobilization protein [Flavobacterium yafengii]
MNIRIGEKAKNGLDRLKKAGRYTTLTSCLEDIVWFFERNKITPRDRINQELNEQLFRNSISERRSFEELKEFIKADSLSLRKRFGAIERDYFKNFAEKIDAVYSIVNKIPDDELSGYFRDVDGLFDSRNNMLIKLNEELEKSQLKNRSLEEKTQEYHRCLEAINKAVRLERTTVGNKIFIDLSKEEAEKLFYLIP